ncbi:hypothetical protein HOY82DRAFT_557839 [Tuber indicum]|nr:hypothetical protein HOY82DRAFT_557839 [Tuber indicum]
MALSDAMHSNLTHADEPQCSRKNTVVVGNVEKWRRDESVGRERSESQSFVLDLLKVRRVAAR